MQPNSNLKGWSMYRSPAVPFQKCQYSPLIYQNFNIFLNNDFIDFQLKSKLNTKISEGLIKQEGVINKYNNSNLKNRQSINTDKLEEKADNMKINFSLENVSTPHLKPQENILNIYNLNNENFKKFQSSIITKGNKSSIFSSSLTSEQINPLDQKKLKYETKIIINQEKKVQFKCDESYLDNEKEFGEEESLEDDEEWVPSKENELLKNKRKNLKADKTIEYSLSELELIKKSIISTIKLRNNQISKKARKIALTNFTNLINSKGTILRKNLLNFKGFNFFSDLKKKMNEYLLKISKDSENSDIQNDKPLQKLVVGDNPNQIFEFIFKMLEEELEILKSKQSNSNNTLQFSICEGLYDKLSQLVSQISIFPQNSNEKDLIVGKQKEIKVDKVKCCRTSKTQTFKCFVCLEDFSNGQALGGHMSRTHPHHSEKYKKKKEIRQNRTCFRQALKEAKTELLKRFNLCYSKLSSNKESKKLIKNTILANKEMYKEIMAEIKEKLNIKKATSCTVKEQKKTV